MAAEIECVARKWGSSLGITIPKDVVEKEHISENQKIIVSIKKKHKAKEFFGMFPNWKRSTEEIKREMKRGWE